MPGSISSDGFSPRLILSFDPERRRAVNAQVARGFRLGGINDPLNDPLCSATDLHALRQHPQTNWEDEKAWNYEIGAKTQWTAAASRSTAAVFYSDIENLQAIVDAGSCSSRIV